MTCHILCCVVDQFMHLNELEQLSGAHNKQVTELENRISQLQVCNSKSTL